MQLEEFLSRLSLPGAGTHKLETLLLVTQTTLQAIKLVERDEQAKSSYARQFADLEKRIQATIDARRDEPVWNRAFDSQAALRAEYNTEINHVQHKYVGASRDFNTFSKLYKSILFTSFQGAGFGDITARKAFEESIVGAIIKQTEASNPSGQGESNPLSHFSELFQAALGGSIGRFRILPWTNSSTSNQENTADYYRPSFNTDITGPIYGSDLDPDEYHRDSTASVPEVGPSEPESTEYTLGRFSFE